jgi:hypothetical protein
MIEIRLTFLENSPISYISIQAKNATTITTTISQITSRLTYLIPLCKPEFSASLLDYD